MSLRAGNSKVMLNGARVEFGTSFIRHAMVGQIQTHSDGQAIWVDADVEPCIMCDEASTVD